MGRHQLTRTGLKGNAYAASLAAVFAISGAISITRMSVAGACQV